MTFRRLLKPAKLALCIPLLTLGCGVFNHQMGVPMATDFPSEILGAEAEPTPPDWLDDSLTLETQVQAVDPVGVSQLAWIDEETLLVGGRRGQLHRWKLAADQPEVSILVARNKQVRFALLPQLSLVAVVADTSRLAFYDLETLELVWEDAQAHRLNIDRIQSLQDGRLIATLGNDRLALWDADSRRVVDALGGDEATLSAPSWMMLDTELLFSDANQQTLMFGTASVMVGIFRADSRQVVPGRWHSFGGARDVAFRPNEQDALVLTNQSEILNVSTSLDGFVAPWRLHSNTPQAAAWHPSGLGFASTGNDATLALTFAAEGKPTATASLPSPGAALAWSPDAKTLALGDTYGNVHWLDATLVLRRWLAKDARIRQGARVDEGWLEWPDQPAMTTPLGVEMPTAVRSLSVEPGDTVIFPWRLDAIQWARTGALHSTLHWGQRILDQRVLTANSSVSPPEIKLPFRLLPGEFDLVAELHGPRGEFLKTSPISLTVSEKAEADWIEGFEAGAIDAAALRWAMMMDFVPFPELTSLIEPNRPLQADATQQLTATLQVQSVVPCDQLVVDVNLLTEGLSLADDRFPEQRDVNPAETLRIPFTFSVPAEYAGANVVVETRVSCLPFHIRWAVRQTFAVEN